MSLTTDFKAAFPQFNSAKVDSLLPGLILEYPSYYAPAYGASPSSDRSTLLLLAHLFVVENSPSPNQVNQFASSNTDTVGGSFRFKAEATDFVSFMNATKYGQRFLISIKKRQGGVFV
jgi:hypothetical protein